MEKRIIFFICNADLEYAIPDLPECSKFNIIIDCANCKVLQGNLVLNENIVIFSDTI